MGKFFDYVTGGNAKVCANKIADLYENRGDYWQTVYSYRDWCMMQQCNGRQYQYVGLLSGLAMENLTVLCAIDLNIFASTQNTSLNETLSFVKVDVERQLRRRGIPEKFITGDNTE